MTSRCHWCGRYIAADTQPIAGVNRYGVHLQQLLCAECGPHWRDLSARNAAALKATTR